MRSIEELLFLAKSNNEDAVIELTARFARKMLKECYRYGRGSDEEMQAYLLQQFIEMLWNYTPRP